MSSQYSGEYRDTLINLFNWIKNHQDEWFVISCQEAWSRYEDNTVLYEHNIEKRTVKDWNKYDLGSHLFLETEIYMPEDLEYDGFSGIHVCDNKEEEQAFLKSLPGYGQSNVDK